MRPPPTIGNLQSTINQPQSPIKLVCFDLGGVLVQIHHTWDEAVLAAGFEPSRTFGHLTQFRGIELLQSSLISQEDYLDQLSEFLSLPGAAEALLVHDSVPKCPYPGTLELVESLNAAGIVTACLSNTNAAHWEEMLSGPRFPNVQALTFKLASHEARMSKPQPEIYREMERIAGCRGDEILFFDDVLVNVEAARACGWQAELIDPESDTAQQMRGFLASIRIEPSWLAPELP